jgi:transposase, IS5 family
MGIRNLRDFDPILLMATDDFFRSRLDQMIDLRHPLAVLAGKMPWEQIEQALAPVFEHKDRQGRQLFSEGLFGPNVKLAGVGPSNAGRPRLPTRLMVSLLYLKHAYDVSDQELVARWTENVQWQYFSGMEYYEPKFPCDPAQITRFRQLLGEAGVEELLKATIDAAVKMKAIRPSEFERVIVDSTVSEKAITYPTDNRLLEIARYQLVKAAKAVGIKFKQTYATEGKGLRRKAAGYAHAKQFRRLKRTLKRQRTIVGIMIREIERKLAQLRLEQSVLLEKLTTLLQRAQRLVQQKPKDKNKLYALHAPEVECIGKGKARQPYEFGVKAGFAITHKRGLIVGARTFPGNPFDGHTLAEQLEQTRILIEDHGTSPKQVYVDLGYRGVDHANPDVEIIHRGKYRSLAKADRKRLRRRQAVEPTIGHLKADHGMSRCWLKGSSGDALHVVLCAAGFNLKWLLRAIARLGLLAPVCLYAFVRQLTQINEKLAMLMKNQTQTIKLMQA